MYHRILVPLDGSTFAERALPLATALARSSGATLYLVHAHAPLIVLGPGPYALRGMATIDSENDGKRRASERAYLERLGSEVARSGGLRVNVAMVDWPIPEALCDYVARADIDLVVMTTHGRGGIERLWLGSVADAFVRHSHVPVLLVRPHDGMVDVDATHPIRNILVPLDGSPLSKQIVEPAFMLATQTVARLRLIQVVEPVTTAIYDPLAYGSEAARQATDERISEAGFWLAGIAAPLRARGAEVETAVLTDPLPARAILEYAQQHAADVIAMATHGRGGVARLLIGSVADKVLRGADIPVLLLRPIGHERELQGTPEPVEEAAMS